MKANRHLKTGSKARRSTRSYRLTFIPAIDLSGKWLLTAGFAIGQPLNVSVEPGRILIQTRQ